MVTGSNRGIGLAIAEGLADEWDGDIFITSRDKKKGEEVSLDWFHYTVWTFHDFSVILILREINFGESRSSKTANCSNFRGSELC